MGAAQARTSGKRTRTAWNACKVLRVALAFALAIGAISSLCGCRYSDVLTEHVWQAGAPVDDSLPPSYKNVDDATPQDFQSYRQNTTDRIDNQVQEIPAFSELPTDVQETIRSQHAEDSVDRGEASDGLRPDDDKGATMGSETAGNRGSAQGTGTGDAGVSERNPIQVITGAETANDNSQTSQGDESERNTVPTNTPRNDGQDPTGGNGGGAQVYNDGTYQDLPQNVHTVAAVGQYATIVQMLAGEGALVAADQSWVSTMSANAAFPDEGVEGVKVAWSGDGLSAGSADVRSIIDARPDAVLVASNASTLTQSEANQLNEAGISVVVMPEIADEFVLDSDVTTAVRVVGELLRNANTQYDAPSMAKDYISFHDDVLNTTMQANGGYTMALLGSANYNWLYQGSSVLWATSTPYVSSTRYATAYANGWDSAGVPFWVTSDKNLGDIRSWLGNRVYPGVEGSEYLLDDGQTYTDNIGGIATIPVYWKSSVPSSRSVYPLVDYYFQHAGAMDGDLLTSLWSHWGPRDTEHLFSLSLWFEWTVSGGYDFVSLGDPRFPGIVARDADVADRIRQSGEKPNGQYNYGLPYKVWVMPEGVSGNWADGNVESFLSAPWLYCQIQRNEDLSDCTNYVSQFYRYFYRCGYESAMRSYGATVSVDCPNVTPDNRYQDEVYGKYKKTPDGVYGSLGG